MQTPLFPIQEAVSSASSLPANSNHKSLPMVIENDEEHKLHNILHNYQQSEREYLVELKTLYSIVKNFDPVYNNYYDGSMDDITDEMVEERREKNERFKKLVSQMISKHTEMGEILKLPQTDTILMTLTNWSDGITEIYTNYIGFYKLDVSQCKTEIKIRRRPLIRIRYLNDLFKSLKEIIILMGEKPYTASVLSSFEILIFRLTKCLELSKEKDDFEKKKCENELYTINAKDIVHLTPVFADVRQSHLNKEYLCDMHYVSQSTTLNFMNISVVTLKDTTIDQLVILQRDTFGKHLLFAPLRKNEFTLQMTNEISGKSLVFSHSVLKDQLKICFTFNKNTNPELSSVLLGYFPKYVPSAIYNIPDFGLGVRLGKDAKDITKSVEKKVIPVDENKELKETQALVPVPNVQEKKTEDIKFKEMSTNTNENNNNNTPLYLKFASNDNLVGSQSNSKHAYNLINKPLELKKESELSKRVLHQIASGDVSDEENDADEVESIISTECTQGLCIEPIQRHPTLPDEPVVSAIKEEKTTPLVEATSANKPLKTINIEKYQNSLQVNVKPKRKSIFGAFSNLLSKKQSKVQQNANANANTNTSTNEKPCVSNISLQSMSSVLSLNDDAKVETILNQATSKKLPSAAVALWNNCNWTKSKNLNLSLHSIANTKFYIGFDETGNEKPLLLLQLDESTDCMFNTVDIHLKTKNMQGNDVTASIRPLDRHDMKIIGNALVNPELCENIVNNSFSVSSDLSTASQVSKETTATSIESDTEKVATAVDVENAKEEKVVERCKTWAGVGDLKLIMNSRKLENLNRCVVNVKNIEKNVVFDLTGFEFGNIELKVDSNQIKIIENNGILINGRKQGVYLLSLDSIEDIRNFRSCVY